jgi:hypothetical protein
MGLAGKQLRLHAEAILDVRAGLAVAIVYLEDDSTAMERAWVCLDHLDKVLDDLLPILDPEWGVTEYIEYRWSPSGVAYSPAEWTDPPPPPGPLPGASRDW